MRRESKRSESAARSFLGNPLAVIGVLIILVFAVMVAAHPLFMATIWAGQGHIYDPITGYDAPIVHAEVVKEVTDPSTQVSLRDARSRDITSNIGDFVTLKLQPAPPSSAHWLGTDTFGRDVFSLILAGARPTFIVGLSAALVSALLGTTMAVAAAIVGGGTDRLLSKFSDVLLLFPAPLAMIVLSGGSLGEFLSPLIFGVLYGVLAGGSTVAIVLRSQALATIRRPFIDAARVSGASGWHLAWRHLVPHLIPLVAATVLTSVVGAVVANGFASWLAYSDDLTNWGALMFVAISFTTTNAFPWNVFFAGAIAISLFCAGFYLTSLGLKDAAFRRREHRRSGWTIRPSRSWPPSPIRERLRTITRR